MVLELSRQFADRIGRLASAICYRPFLVSCSRGAVLSYLAIDGFLLRATSTHGNLCGMFPGELWRALGVRTCRIPFGWLRSYAGSHGYFGCRCFFGLDRSSSQWTHDFDAVEVASGVCGGR